MTSKDNSFVIYVEYRKGILFLHLKGSLKRNNILSLKRTIRFFQRRIGIRYFAVDLEKVDIIDKNSLFFLWKYPTSKFVFYNVKENLRCMRNLYQLDNERKVFDFIKI